MATASNFEPEDGRYDLQVNHQQQASPSRPEPPPATTIHSEASPASGPDSSPFTDDNCGYDAHRQSHNSSKLPAFRFADLKKEPLTLPSLLPQQDPHLQPQNSQNPQTHNSSTGQPTNPVQAAEINHSNTNNNNIDNRDAPPYNHPPTNNKNNNNQPMTTTITTAINHDSRDGDSDDRNNNKNQTINQPASPPSSSAAEPSAAQTSPSRSRASTFQTASAPTATTVSASVIPAGRRPASYPDSPSAGVKHQKSLDNARTPSSSAATILATQQPEVKQRRKPDSFSSNGTDVSSAFPPSVSTKRSSAPESAQGSAADDPTKEWAQGQRELLLPKSVQDARVSHEKRKSTSRPPVSFRPPRNDGSSTRVPPIRSFRSSGSRRSLDFNMSPRISSSDEGEDFLDGNQRDRTLRALEGRGDEDMMTPPDSAGMVTEGETTADIFMRIAREDPTHKPADERRAAEDRSVVSRVARSHRRPLSAAIPQSEVPNSPPQVPRRLSDQTQTSRTYRYGNDRASQLVSRDVAYRGSVRDRLNDNTANSKDGGVSLRPSPVTPRTLVFQNSSTATDAGSANGQRRTSVPDVNTTQPSRTSYKGRYGVSTSYNSSPLVPKSTQPEASHGVEGTESTASTAAPSTVWDELDDLKSRIHRLELTGKLPATSGAAISRASDERPPTATTIATTMSASPKRGAGNANPPVDVVSTTSSAQQKETQPILLSALTKFKTLISPDVYSAIETAAKDALALQSMVGVAGQPGPISSGASTIGAGGTITDRQLRRKTDSICRSLTELCLALGEEAALKKIVQGVQVLKEAELVTSPTVNKFPSLVSSRRPGTTAESALAKANSSPRAPSRLEERRATMLSLNSPAMPSPRYAATPGTSADNTPTGRKSSLLVSRARRAGTEDPEDSSTRKASTLLRTRRAGTEEPEEGRKSSLLLRSRKTVNQASEDQEETVRFRAPSRATTEVAASKGTREYHSQGSPQDSTSTLGSSALPRRRLMSSNPPITSRLGTSTMSSTTGTTTTTSSGRRYLDRATPDRDGSTAAADKLAEDRGQRQFSLAPATTVVNRSETIERRRRSALPMLSSTTSQTGAYR